VSTSEEFWLSIVDELDGGDLKGEIDPVGFTEEVPLWVLRCASELFTLLVPRFQLRVGQRATPGHVGSLLAMQMILNEALSPFVSVGSEEGKKLRTVLHRVTFPWAGFDAAGALSSLPEQHEKLRLNVADAVSRILTRPNHEVYEFLNAVARGIRPHKGHAPRPEWIRKRLSTIAIYGAVLLNWRKFDGLQSSREAYDLLLKMLPVEVVGHSHERVRRMFERGYQKHFGPPGRPVKKRKRHNPC
jgi:hypothetical protein